MISKQGLSDLAADVRDINYGNSIKELVFNPETGDFEACARGISHGSGEIVTEMTEGGFALMDFDRVELHNLARHIATVNDIGRLKTDVVEDAIKGKNPYAVVVKHSIDLNDNLVLLSEEVRKADIVVCATDNNRSRFALSKVLKEEGKVGIFGRAITRAEGGDVFRYRPGGPCYSCLIGKGFSNEEEISDLQAARRDGRIPAYVSQEDAEAMVQVGLSSDILPICNLMGKLVLVELSKGMDSGISSLEDELTYDYYIWANRRDRHYANWKPFQADGQGPTILKWYGVRVERNPDCPLCGERINLESEEGIIEGLEGIEPELQ